MGFETLAAISAQLEANELLAEEVTHILLSQIDALNPTYGAFSDVLVHTALADAKASDIRRAKKAGLGPLDGVPIAIKNLIDTTPAKCSAGMVHLGQYQPETDASVVQSLRAAGAVILGVTQSDPGAFDTVTPQVINPLAPAQMTGGSSGGSGAAVAAGLAFAAIGTDTGGSIRIPAACCCVYGFKPTWGRVDATGVRPLAYSADHVGPIARCVEDLEMIQAQIDPRFLSVRDTAVDKPISLGICEGFLADASAEIADGFEIISDQLCHDQVMLKQVDLPRSEAVMDFHMVNVCKQAASYHIQHFPKDWRDYPDIARTTIEVGLGLTNADYQRAEQARNDARAAVDRALQDVDALLLPAMPIDAPLRGAQDYMLGGKKRNRLETTIWYTALFNQTGHPVVCMPAMRRADGRSVNIQLVGRLESDADLLALARRCECLFAIEIDYEKMLAQHADQARAQRIARDRESA